MVYNGGNSNRLGGAKDAIGRLWAAKSGSKCLYATVYKSEGGLDVRAQLDKLFATM